MTTTIIGFPRIGEHRELKFATQKYFKHQITADELNATAATLRQQNWRAIQDAGIDQIPSGDFSFFDTTLDTAFLLNIVPQRYRELGLSPLDEYFALARGYQGAAGDVKALPMKKWFNTNYHYLVPEFDQDTNVQLVGNKLFDEFKEAQALGITTRPTLVGPYTLLRLARFVDGRRPADFVTSLTNAYREILGRLNDLGAQWVQIDEPALVYDQTDADRAIFTDLYQGILAGKGNLKVLLQTYFGDVRDSATTLYALDFDGIGLDLVEGATNLDVLREHPFPDDKTLFAGVINGKNIWKANYTDTLKVLGQATSNTTAPVVLTTSCSLLHVPYTLANETKLPEQEK
ncbi:5-methyltetrahydropteroyltriglutamate homocysteine S-methyltransferase [Lacticaseibacillus pantheris DSM 15945 = JCM 12539 = NBRC 106106]|uniref:5-methyltetrahydropteroyltriglutamate homocysteine S-methyltransferase n=2 Tax=Lacticaseibacillus pantheris TaxID=171523 RepID=A0A0R1U472_9LACO|nr:5-methyltetrahydropteroyltriglutamate homocysteine S-methyltransferase [Lacticaseibacillus pantheris DSM 15945 = JCM 12539 = NBRC 106106]